MKTTLFYWIVSLLICFSATAQNPELHPPGKNRKNYLSQKQLSDYADNATAIKKTTSKAIPFRNLTYNKVIAYDYEGNEEPFGSIATKEGRFVPVVLRQKSLNQKQAEQIITILTDKNTYGEGTAACFNPHLGLIFYNYKEIVFKADICLGCNYLIPSKDIPAMNHKKITFDDGGFYYAVGFTASGKRKIKELCKELGFFYGK